MCCTNAARAQRPFLGLCSHPSESACGEADEIETDRDSFTPATTTVGDGHWVVEAAHSFVDNRGVPETHSFPELLVRRGFGDNLELRLGWNYEVGGAGSPVSGNLPSDLGTDAELERESRVLYGFKALLTQQDNGCPESSLILQGFTPTSGESTTTEMSATYVFGWVFENETVWDTALRYGTGSLEEDRFDVWAPSTVIKIPLGERWKVHAEYFGIFSDGREQETSQHFFSPGAHYLITRDLEIGLRVGWGLNDQSANFFSNAGFGLRF
ncbi:transporter [Roseimaritima ulvae]|uniref:MetA-pathway of phenol degradation n=1 Tax=Roseimaritima ulvae TaxID=980254 RepID=A0A5B9QXL8_9BACT|nr:transporter [Roseimaritima ulvae]QEG42752.1 hypothetical protein UC8_47940 [Roseimaritima ulvae]